MDTPMEFAIASHTKLIPSSTSKTKKKNVFSHKKNPDYPPKPYRHLVIKVALDYFKKHSLESLKQHYLDHGEDRFMSLQIDLLREITNALASYELYNNYNSNYWKHGRWFV